jgi:hypothetical protein
LSGESLVKKLKNYGKNTEKFKKFRKKILYFLTYFPPSIPSCGVAAISLLFCFCGEKISPLGDVYPSYENKTKEKLRHHRGIG